MIIPCKEDIGRAVVYMRGQPPFEEGVIVSMNSQYVFVRYGAEKHSKATNPIDLEWSHRVPRSIAKETERES